MGAKQQQSKLEDGRPPHFEGVLLFHAHLDDLYSATVIDAVVSGDTLLMDAEIASGEDAGDKFTTKLEKASDGGYWGEWLYGKAQPDAERGNFTCRAVPERDGLLLVGDSTVEGVKYHMLGELRPRD